MKKKILIVIQNISKAQEHEWFVEYINREIFEIHFLLINSKDTWMDKFLQQKNVPVYYLKYKNKTELPVLTYRIFRLLLEVKFDVIHTHLFEATLAGLTAAFFAGIRKRIYTRHHSDYHHVWFPSAVKYDRYNNFLATDIVAISRNVQHILVELENASPSKIHLIHHGIDLTDYKPGAVSAERVELLRKKYNLNDKGPILGAISRFTEWKGVQFIIPAFINVLAVYPDAVLVLANANGDYKQEIIRLLSDIDTQNLRLIEFENDIAALYKTFDCFIHVPINPSAEAFGQTYLESLASMIPSVITLSGVAVEFVKDNSNAFVVPYQNSAAILNKVIYILTNKDSVADIVKTGYTSVKDYFDIQIKISKLEQLYSDI